MKIRLTKISQTLAAELENGHSAPMRERPLTSDPNPEQADAAWSIEESEKLYRIRGWGEPYFPLMQRAM